MLRLCAMRHGLLHGNSLRIIASKFCSLDLFSRETAVDTAISSLVATARHKHVAVAISGGVDSAVAAHLLKEQGHTVSGIFMQNWDEAEERGNSNCSARQDLADAQAVCQKLHISLHTVNFVKEYWSDVFTSFISQCERGLTPNPDLLCNKVIKFDLLIRQAKQLGADTLATGHYAQLRLKDDGNLQLLRARDREKDQTYFLASVPGKAFCDVLFPLGGLLKSEVRAIATSIGLHNALRRSSAGICFIGRRKFGKFLAGYSQEQPGIFLDVDSREVLGKCHNIAALTHGQRAGPGGASDRMFVAGKDMQCKIVYLALGPHHPALYTKTATLRPASWIAGQPPAQLLETGMMAALYKARYGQLPSLGHILQHSVSEHVSYSKYTVLMPEDIRSPSEEVLQVRFLEAERAITPQQEFVMYDGDVCLGSAPILHPGPTLLEDHQAGQLELSQACRA